MFDNLFDTDGLTEKTVFTPLVLLYSNGGEVEALTRMQKMCYFVELECSGVSFGWKQTKWGHHSEVIDLVLDSYIERGHMTREVTGVAEKYGGTHKHHSYTITESGKELVEKNLAGGSFDSLVGVCEDVTGEYGTRPITQVLLAAEKKPNLY